MLIYNTTYQVDMNDARNFVIWLTECYIPEVEKRKIDTDSESSGSR